jgi:general stress protein 26
MNPIRLAGVICFAAVLSLLTLVHVSDAYAQETTAVPMPRDSILAAARDMMAKARFCALITLDASGHPRARTMDAFPPDENMVVWMGTAVFTRKVEEIRKDPRVTLYYADPKYLGYVTVYGTATLVDTPEEKDKRWREEYASYFPEGKKSYILIAVTPQRIEIVDYSHGINGDPKTWRPETVTF